jgi:HAE1 family hydrophobic/amphiphilic exporter-1
MLGTTVVSGMLAATVLGIFFVPALFVFIERLAGHKDAPQTTATPKAERKPIAGSHEGPPARLTAVD